MKHDCDIVRDLMPMCIDGTASEKAKQMVDEHVAECPPCDKVYAEMKGEAKIELPVQPAAPEFVTTVKKMKNRRKRRAWLTLLLGVMIAAVVALVGFYGYFWYFIDVTLMDDAQLSLVMSNDGIALIHASNVPKSAGLALRAKEMVYPEAAKGQFEVWAEVYATRHAARSEGDDIYFVLGDMDQGTVFMMEGDVQVYRMLAASSDGSGKVFHLAGEEIKAISIKGMYVKSPETISVTPGQPGNQLYPYVTATPMPNWRTNITDSGAVVIRTATPPPEPTATPTPTARIEYLGDVPFASVPASITPTPEP